VTEQIPSGNLSDEQPSATPLAQPEQAQHLPQAPAPQPPSLPSTAESKRQLLALIAGLAGWIVPGAGHLLLKMYGRAAACFLSVALLVVVGAGMRGNIFTRDGDDAFSKLGYVADLGSGVFYWVAKRLEVHGTDVSHAAGDYGTRLLATAGVLNLLVALHAYEVTRGRKS
jgi:uncharacterized protein DUF6677